MAKKRSWVMKIWEVVILLFLATTLVGLGSSVKVFNVTDTSELPDQDPDDGTCATSAGTCTLRAAFEQANTLARSTIIMLSPGTYPITSGFIIRNSITISTPAPLDPTQVVLNIRGATRSSFSFDAIFSIRKAAYLGIDGVTIRSGSEDRRTITGQIFSVWPSGELLLSHVDIQNVFQDISDQPVIANYHGTTTLRHVRIENTEGDVIQNAGELTLSNVTISGTRPNARGPYHGVVIDNGNRADPRGPKPVLKITNSTIGPDNISSSRTGGCLINYGIASIINSTITGNSVLNGRCIDNQGQLTIQSSTLTNNQAQATVITGVGRIWYLFQPEEQHKISLTLRNTILAANQSDRECMKYTDQEVEGVFARNQPLISQGYNILGSTCEFKPENRSTPNDLVLDDPKLGPLTDNGGPTYTHLPLKLSPPVNAGSPSPPGGDGRTACPATDQRGISRTAYGGCDIGAVERNRP